MRQKKKKVIIPTIDVKKYGGKQVAILDGKVIATGHNLREIITKIKKSKPSRPLSEIHIFSVPKTLSVVYYVKN